MNDAEARHIGALPLVDIYICFGYTILMHLIVSHLKNSFLIKGTFYALRLYLILLHVIIIIFF